MTRLLHLAVALDGAGWHPAAWRLPSARPAELLTAGYWVDLTRRAEAGLLDFVTIEDALALQSSSTSYSTNTARRQDRRGPRPAGCRAHRGPGRAPDRAHRPGAHRNRHPHRAVPPVQGDRHPRLRLAGSGGLAGAGLRPTRGSRALRPPEVPRLDLRQDDPAARRLLQDLFDEAGDAVEVVRRLWDSWEDDAEIRDVATGRFVDREKLHYIDFEGRWFNVRGPSITPRPPQGQPVVVALAHGAVPRAFAGRSADVVFVTPSDNAAAAAAVAEIAEVRRGPAGTASTTSSPTSSCRWTPTPARPAAAGNSSRPGRDGRSPATPRCSSARRRAWPTCCWLAPTPGSAASGSGRPRCRRTSTSIVDALVPELQRRGAFRTAYEADTLRGLLGLSRPANRYASTEKTEAEEIR